MNNLTPTIPCGFENSPSSITVGEKLILKCAVESPGPSASAEFINKNEEVPYSLVFLGRPEMEGAVVKQVLTSYKVGRFEFSHVVLKLNDKTFQVSPFKFEVSSVLPPPQEGQKETQAVPSVGPLTLNAPWWWWAMWAFLAVSLLTFIVVKFLKWKKAKELKKNESTKFSKVLSPQEKFTQSLQKLESQGWHLRGEYKKFALELTVILKKSTGEKFKFAAEDMTTEEFVETLEKKQAPFMSRAGKILIGELGSLDQIKFAKTEVTTEKCLELLDDAKRIGSILYGENS